MRNLENKELDEIGAVLVKSGMTSNRDIERAVSNPELFDAIKNRIAMIEDRPERRRSVLLVPRIAAFAGIALVAVVGLAIFRSGTPRPKETVAITPSSNPAKGAQITKHSEPDGSGTLPPAEHVSRSERVSTRPPVVRAVRQRQPVAQQARFVDDFYAVSYAGDPHETERGGRIVRVDIPRSTLFAMGINVPLENESPTVKADLLVGSDGVTRAIRVVE
jgi:hypothetical protein